MKAVLGLFLSVLLASATSGCGMTNEFGEMPGGPAVAADNFPVYTDISAGQPSGSGINSSAVIDIANGKLLIVTDNGANGDKPALFQCNLDGTGCTYTDISASQPASSGIAPSAVIDMANGKLLVVTEDNANNNGEPALFRCNLDGTGCTYKDISAGQPASSLSGPRAIIDTANSKLLVVMDNFSNNDKLALFRCNLDGTDCTYTDISAGQPTDSGFYPSAVIDTANSKLLVVTMDKHNFNKPALFRCNLDGTGCTYTDISAGQPTDSGFYPSAVIDTANRKLLVVTEDMANFNKPTLFRCNLDGTGCTYTDISAGQPVESSAPGGADFPLSPSAVIDTANGKLLVVTEDNANNGEPALFRCNLDGTGCTYTDISAGQPSNSGWNPSAVIDTTNSKLLVVTSDYANSAGKLALFSIGL